jgi:formylglycine-generating enzyme required for sulfatase activity
MRRRSTGIALTAMLVILAPSAWAEVTIDWVTVGDPGNDCENIAGSTCKGTVAYTYRIGKYEVAVSQYVDLLNAVASTDTYGLYPGDSTIISRAGSPGSYSYTAVPGRGNHPVQKVTHYDILRFANWLHNGQPPGAQDSSTTEDGAYTITAQGVADHSIVRNPQASFFLVTDDEWHKAAYYDASLGIYYNYPAGTDTEIVCSTPGATSNTANCFNTVGYFTVGGAYTGSPSPYGTFDQGGNVGELTESKLDDFGGRLVRGGSFASSAGFNVNFAELSLSASNSLNGFGFRLGSPVPTASPVPSFGLLGTTALFGALGLAGWRRLRR